MLNILPLCFKQRLPLKSARRRGARSWKSWSSRNPRSSKTSLSHKAVCWKGKTGIRKKNANHLNSVKWVRGQQPLIIEGCHIKNKQTLVDQQQALAQQPARTDCAKNWNK